MSSSATNQTGEIITVIAMAIIAMPLLFHTSFAIMMATAEVFLLPPDTQQSQEQLLGYIWSLLESSSLDLVQAHRFFRTLA